VNEKVKKVRVGLVGIGRLGKQHADNLAFRIPNCELTAICSLSEEDVKDAQAKWSIPYGYTDYNEMLSNQELDAIFISSPSNFHREHIIKALEANFHVFSEKPLGLYLEEAIEIQEVVEKHLDKVFMLGFMRRYDPSYVAAKQKIDRGDIGQPILIRCYGLDPASELDNFLRYAKKNYSGGMFLDMLIHDLDLARWYLGTEAREVWSIGGSYSRPEFEEIEDIETGAAMVRFENNAIGIFVGSRNCAYGYHIETEIIGTEGSIRIGALPERNQVVLLNEGGIIKESFTGFLERFGKAYQYEAEEFVNCILENRKPEITVYDGVASTRLAYACQKSFDTGDLVKI